MTSSLLPDVELHNIAELDADAGYPGALIRRYSRAVAESFDNGSLVSEDASLSELRFVPVSGRRLAVSFTSLAGGDYLASRDDWDFITCEIGVNMRGHHEADEFERRVRHLAEFAPNGLHLLDGLELLPGMSGLTGDFVHPSTEGHTQLAENLANRLRDLVC